MHRQHKPNVDGVANLIAEFPHCDQRVLHAPGECEYCDAHKEWQALRVAWGIAFTGYEPDVKELPCPADFARPNGAAERWSGNHARPAVKPGTCMIATLETDGRYFCTRKADHDGPCAAVPNVEPRV